MVLSPSLVLWLMLAYLVFIDPVLGKKMYQNLEAGRQSPE